MSLLAAFVRASAVYAGTWITGLELLLFGFARYASSTVFAVEHLVFAGN
jgi:hypothetical protein